MGCSLGFSFPRLVRFISQFCQSSWFRSPRFVHQSFSLRIQDRQSASLRGIGLSDEAVVFSLATLAVIELRGAIPVGYLLQLNVFSVLGSVMNYFPISFAYYDFTNSLDIAVVETVMTQIHEDYLFIVIFVENILKLESDSIEEFVGSSVLRLDDHAERLGCINRWDNILHDDPSKSIFSMELEDESTPKTKCSTTKPRKNTKLIAKKSGRKVPENGASGNECNGDSEVTEKSSVSEEPCSTSEEMVKTMEGKARGELKPPRVLEALSASGLRALRYAREIEGVGQVVALDNDEACRRNIKFNGSVAISKVESNLADARVYMLTHQKEFDVV
ncbi:Probable tRNA (guanine(26)-N(2))-dimethyltransferase 2 [Linum perenne]